jgi:hypothetical protein
MSRGTLIAESIKPGRSLEGIPLTVLKIERDVATNATGDQPRIWTGIDFETTERPERLAEALAAVLDDKPSVWYCNFTDRDEVFIAYPNRVFHYHRGDASGRQEAQRYGRSLGVPSTQLDWTE